MFNSVTGSIAGRSRKRKGRQSPRTQIIAMQASLLQAATDPNVPAGYRAQAARAWDTLEERLRIIDGKPLPGHLKPELEQRRRAKRVRSAITAISSADLPQPSDPAQSA